MIEFFEKFPDVLAIMSQKKDGSMKFSEDENVWFENKRHRETFFTSNNIESGSVVSAGLEHGSNVEVVRNLNASIISKTDSLVTNRKGISLAITVADCVPILFFEKQKGIVAITHAGWKGVVGNVIENTLKEIFELGGSIGDLQIVLGPAIGNCHFEIKEDILDQFSEHTEFVTRRDGKIFADLKGIILKKLSLVGVTKENIENNETCTFCDENFFSFRRDKPKITEAMVVLIGLK